MASRSVKVQLKSKKLCEITFSQDAVSVEQLSTSRSVQSSNLGKRSCLFKIPFSHFLNAQFHEKERRLELSYVGRKGKTHGLIVFSGQVMDAENPAIHLWIDSLTYTIMSGMCF